MKANEITFGIEIECYIPFSQRSLFTIGGHHNGAQIDQWPAGWNAQPDGSLSAPAGYFPVEVVSPVLQGEDGLVQVASALMTLNELGAISNDRCGIHIHIGVANLPHGDIQRIVTAFKRYEKAFFALNGDKMQVRMGNTFCKPSEQWDSGRYNSLNRSNVGRANKNTLECRCFAANLNVEFAIAGIYMITALVSRVTETTIRPMSESLPADKAVGRFIHDHFNGDRAAQYTIIPDERPRDVARYIRRQLGATNQNTQAGQ